MTEAIKTAARAIAEARVLAKRAEMALSKADDGRVVLEARRDALKLERATIVEKARSGTTDAELALRLLVIEADLGDLEKLVATADAEFSKAQSAALEARQHIGSAEWQLSQARADEMEGRLLVHADRLGALLLETITELVASGARKGSRPIWAPSPALADAINRAHLNRGNVRQ
jgi:hypothetical protein